MYHREKRTWKEEGEIQWADFALVSKTQTPADDLSRSRQNWHLPLNLNLSA